MDAVFPADQGSGLDDAHPYAQFSYGFNYYGTIGTNRDEFVVVRKMAKVDWLDTPLGDERAEIVQAQGEGA